MVIEIERFTADNVTANDVLKELAMNKKVIKSLHVAMIFDDDSSKSLIIFENELHLISMLGALRVFIDNLPK